MTSFIFYLFFIGWRSGWLSVCKYEEKQLPCVKLAIKIPFKCGSMNVQVRLIGFYKHEKVASNTQVLATIRIVVG